MKRNYKVLSAFTLTSAFALCGWLLPACTNNDNELFNEENTVLEGTTGNGSENGQENGQQPVTPAISPNQSQNNAENPPQNNQPQSVSPETKPAVAEYIQISSSGVNIRSSASTSGTVLGKAEKGERYACLGKTGSWYKTVYRDKTAYINTGYCSVVNMQKCQNDKIEKVIEEGCKYLGVPYVYGATRYMDGNGKKLSGFTKSAFDCSSLMQYIFKMGADVNLQVTTRTQIYQGKTVNASSLKRGDLMFFTNASRKNNTGIERVGHVALYLGDNYILHTASDYAKIEQITSTRWSYFIQAQRVL